MRLIVLHDGAMVADLVCGREPVFIGNDAQVCKLHLADERLTARLAAIAPGENSTWWIEPLCDEPTMQLNGIALAGRSELRAGDEVCILEYSIRAYPTYDEQPARPEQATTVAQLERFVQSKLPPGAIIRKAEDPLSLQPDLLPRLARVQLGLARCMTVQEVMTVALHTLLEVFAAQRAWLGVRRVNYGPMEYVEGRRITGQTCDLPPTGDLLRPRVVDRGQYIVAPVVSFEERLSVVAGPIAGPEGPLGMMYIDTGDTGRRWGTQDLDHFVLLGHMFGAQLDAIFKEQAANRAATLDGQVIVSHEIQARLTPRKLPQWDSLQFGAFREPGRARTGDIYDIVRLGNQHGAFLIAHTTAAGALPSMLMAQTQATFRCSAMHMDAPNLFMRLLNLLLFDGQRDHQVSAVMGVIDPESGKLRYAMAGQTGAYIISARGEERSLSPAESLPPAGLQKDQAYPLLTETLEPGENLVLFTPGVVTARNKREEVFGEDRFVNILCDGFGQLASVTLKEMLADLRNYTEGGSQPDDITVILAHRV